MDIKHLILGNAVFSEKKDCTINNINKPTKKIRSVYFFLISNLNKYKNANQ